MERSKMPEYVYEGLPKLDTFTFVNKRFTLSFLMNIGLTIMFSGVTLTHVNKCLMTSLEEWPQNSSVHVSSFLIGSIIIQIPAAWFSLKFSPLLWFGRSILIYSILLFLIALLGSVNYGLLVVLKFFEGIVSGTTFVVLHAAWKNWTPAAERSTLITFALTGGYLGDLFGELMSILCSELPFWVFLTGILGSFGIIWWFVWESMVYETPNKHRTITEKEYYYIHPIIREEIRPTEDLECRKIIFSVPFLVLIIVNILRSWNSRLYSFYKEDMIIVQFIKVISFPIAGYLADVLARRTSLTITHVRKIYITGVFSMEFIYFFLLKYVDIRMGNAFYLLSFFMVMLSNVAFASVSINAVDIAPSHAGVTVAIINILSHVVSEISFKIEPYLYEINWYDTINCISIIAHLFVGLVYGIYGSANPIAIKE